MKSNYFFLIIFSINLYSAPWVNTPHDLKYKLNITAEECNDFRLNFSNNYPVSYGELYYLLNRAKDLNDFSRACLKQIKSLLSSIENNIYTKETRIGYQRGHDDIYFQELGTRHYKNSNVFFETSNVFSNYSFNIKISRDLKTDKTFFDESYISVRHQNNIFSIGRKSRWWSPSSADSLILSNTSRPQFGIEIKNYIPFNLEDNFFSFLGGVNYEIFLNKLEKDRHISNALLFGTRISINPFDSLNISLLRLAQFGGEGRPTDSRTILNMLIGRDNSKSGNQSDEPGNQIAGLDFKYSPKTSRKFNIYGQMLGEDEAGYFPSRKFYLFGSSFNLNTKNNPLNSLRLSIDFLDTYSGIKNYTYNHPIYKSGLRYYNLPLGASIDSDSDKISVSLEKSLSKFSDFKVILKKINLNKNSNETFVWQVKDLTFYEAELKYFRMIHDFQLSVGYIQRSEAPGQIYKKNNLIFNIDYKF